MDFLLPRKRGPGDKNEAWRGRGVAGERAQLDGDNEVKLRKLTVSNEGSYSILVHGPNLKIATFASD